jgi:hypothetical protein
MTVEDAIIARLESLPAVTALVGSRIYVGKLPQRAVFPAIRVQAISTIQSTHLRGAGATQRSRVQVDAIAWEGSSPDPVTVARSIDQAAHGLGDGSALCGWTGSVGSPAFTVVAVFPFGTHEAYDAENDLRQYRVIRDYYVWWRR